MRKRRHCGRRFPHAFVPDYRAEAAFRPPPWLALPPLLAISRCFAGSIAANPRLEPPLFVAAMMFFSSDQRTGNAKFSLQFRMLIEVSELLLDGRSRLLL
jgi:hypothetical protein